MQPNTLEVLKSRYFLKDKQGNIVEDWSGLCKRTSSRAAEGVIGTHPQLSGVALETQRNFYVMQSKQEFLANSPVYFNIGTKHEMGSACFILPVGDSIAEIYQAVKNGAVIEKMGGGIGMDFSSLRSENAMTSTGGIASGALSFMTAFDTMTQTIAQGGKRRGAMMAMLNVTHPEILKFIDCKQQTPPERVDFLSNRYGMGTNDAAQVLKDLGWRAPFSNFNISVKLSNEFIQAVHSNGSFMLRNPDGSPYTKELLDPRNDQSIVAGRTADGGLLLNAKMVMDRIIDKAWASGEPGIGFIDRINEDNPVASLGPINNSNPCGEYWQIPYSSCNLGSINLSKFVKEAPPVVGWGDRIEWEHLAEITKTAVSFLEGIMTINQYPIKEIEEVTWSTRPIGLGVMGFADMLLKLQVRYGSEQSVQIAESIMLWIEYHAWLESARLAKVKGAFEHYEENKDYFINKFSKLDQAFTDQFGDARENIPVLSLVVKEHGVRNCQVTTIAPTGTISLVGECSSGIEPIFAFELERRDTVSTRTYSHWFLEYWYKLNNGIDTKLPAYAVEAHAVTPEEHIAIQAAFQKYSDNAVSKTINLPSEATKEDVAKAYQLAWEQGLKSITVYRDGCREGVLIHNGKDKKKLEVITPIKAELVKTNKVPDDGGYMHRPEFLPGATWKVKAPSGTVYVTVNYSPAEGRIVEVFIRENSGNEAWELTGRLLSVLLRSRTSLKQVSKQLLRTRGQSTIVLDGQILTSVAQAIAVVLEEADKYFSQPVLPYTNSPDDVDNSVDEEVVDATNETKDRKRFLDQNCPECGGHTLYKTEGCTKCVSSSCGFNRCGG